MKHRFVEYIPDMIEENILYISIEFDVAVHKCACGCGDDIVTTLSPARWKMIYDGETVSLFPSIGNWSHKCKSHYFITNDKVVWAKGFTEKQIEQVSKNDNETLKKHVKEKSIVEKIVKWLQNTLKF